MSEKEAAKKKKIDDLLSELLSNDETKQIKAVKALKRYGDESVIEPLLEILCDSESNTLNAEIEDVLNTTKSTAVPPKIAAALVNPKYSEIRQVLLVSVWSSGLDYSPYLAEIMTAGTEGEMMDALECITIIEHMDVELTEDQLFEPLLVLNSFLNENHHLESPKIELLKEIAALLQDRNNQL